MADGGEALRLARLIALATPLALLGGAYLGQYAFGLYPCEMCWWQRYAHFAALALALAALVVPRGGTLVALAALAIAVSGAIGAFHAGVEYHWWQGFTACSTAVAAGGDPLAAIMNAPLVRCDQAQWQLFGLSLAGWNFLFSGAAALAIVLLLRRSEARR
ncbi:MAG: disulfide bond formation protein B [Sphingomonadales bacterium]|nr:disulfide bond formation protein B [Sphingomonadales bacterium]